MSFDWNASHSVILFVSNGLNAQIGGEENWTIG